MTCTGTSCSERVWGLPHWKYPELCGHMCHVLWEDPAWAGRLAQVTHWPLTQVPSSLSHCDSVNALPRWDSGGSGWAGSGTWSLAWSRVSDHLWGPVCPPCGSGGHWAVQCSRYSLRNPEFPENQKSQFFSTECNLPSVREYQEVWLHPGCSQGEGVGMNIQVIHSASCHLCKLRFQLSRIVIFCLTRAKELWHPWCTKGWLQLQSGIIALKWAVRQKDHWQIH